MNASGPELRALTGARGIAAWIVVLFHLRVAAEGQFPDWLQALLAKGYLAVDFFFMLSGFVLWLNYRDRIAAAGWGAVPPFLIRRLARIWPLHAFILAGAMMFAGLLALRGTPAGDQFPWGELPLHLLLVQNWGFTGALTWNDPAWSISCEWAAYLLFPLLAMQADWRRLPPELLLALIAGVAAALSLVLQAQGATNLNHDIPHSGLPRAVAEFVIGTLVCGLYLQWRGRPVEELAAWLVPLVFVAYLWAALLDETQSVPFLFALLLLAAALTATMRGNPLASAPIHYLGRISYSTYLVHYLLFMMFKLALTSATDVPWPLLLLYAGLTLGASVLLHHLVELPGQRLVNRWAERRPPRAAAPAAVPAE